MAILNGKSSLIINYLFIYYLLSMHQDIIYFSLNYKTLFYFNFKKDPGGTATESGTPSQAGASKSKVHSLTIILLLCFSNYQLSFLSCYSSHLKGFFILKQLVGHFSSCRQLQANSLSVTN